VSVRIPAPWGKATVDRYRAHIPHIAYLASRLRDKEQVDVFVDGTLCKMTNDFTCDIDQHNHRFAVVILDDKKYFAAWDLVVLPGAQPTTTLTRSKRARRM
jgi:hypothetical protein